MGIILTMLLFAFEIVWYLIKLFGCAIWYVTKVIFKYLFLIAKPVYKFMFKALPITTVFISCGLLFMVCCVLWYGTASKFDKTEQTNTENSVTENKGIIDRYIDKAIARGDSISNTVTSTIENSKAVYSGGPIGAIILCILAFALIPVFILIFFIVMITFVFYEIPIIGLILDTVRHIYICIKYRPNIKETVTEWIRYALSDYIQDENTIYQLDNE